MNHFETYFVAYFAHFTAELHQLKKTLGQFENLVFVIIPTRENIRLIARTFLLVCVQPILSLTRQSSFSAFTESCNFEMLHL